MATKTISLSEDAYERLRAAKREGESFSDVVRRLPSGIRLVDYYGVLDEDTADELEETIARNRSEWTSEHEERVTEIADAFDEECSSIRRSSSTCSVELMN